MKKNRNTLIIKILFVFFVSMYLTSCQNIEVKDYKKNSEEILKTNNDTIEKIKIPTH
tara:strand:+ start:4839 stop:5009 length:171 start_codon:yes stop_codon:yes gene_type:complete